MPSPERLEADRRRYTKWGAILVVIALVPLAFSVPMWNADRELASGPRVRADVVDVLHRRATSKGFPDTSHLRISFTTADGTSVTTTVRTTRRTFVRDVSMYADDIRDLGEYLGEPSLQEFDPEPAPTRVDVTYDPSDPTRVRAVHGPERPWRIPLIAAASVGGIGLLLLWWALRIALGRPSRAYRRGVFGYG